MMTNDGGRLFRNAIAATALTVAGTGTAWLSFRAALIRSVPPATPLVQRVAPDEPDAVLARAATALVTHRGILDAGTLARVRTAAAAAPLDARAYLVLGHQQLLDRQPTRAVRTLEAGRRLDPRQRLIHLLLLDRYLRGGRYAEAGVEFSALSRLMSGTQAPIAAAMAQMSIAPETRDAVRRTLATDPTLERAVLVAMARSTVAPAAIWSLASPAARADAGNQESWGPALIARLVSKGQYGVARAVWQRVYRLPSAIAAAPVFNAGFAPTTASAPFNWVLATGSPGAADLRQGALAVDYYGRDSGELASQLLVLAPGAYRFAVTVDPGKTDAASRLLWSVSCATGQKAMLLDLPVVAAATRRRIGGRFVVPVDCPAQRLALRGEAGEFPVPVAVTIRDVGVRPEPAVLP